MKILLYNGKVLTQDPHNPIADTVFIDNEISERINKITYKENMTIGILNPKEYPKYIRINPEYYRIPDNLMRNH